MKCNAYMPPQYSLGVNLLIAWLFNYRHTQIAENYACSYEEVVDNNSQEKECEV